MLTLVCASPRGTEHFLGFQSLGNIPPCARWWFLWRMGLAYKNCHRNPRQMFRVLEIVIVGLRRAIQLRIEVKQFRLFVVQLLSPLRTIPSGDLHGALLGRSLCSLSCGDCKTLCVSNNLSTYLICPIPTVRESFCMVLQRQSYSNHTRAMLLSKCYWLASLLPSYREGARELTVRCSTAI